MTKTYGVISDLHAVDIRVVPSAIEVLKDKGIDALVLNGDLFGERSGYSEQDFFGMVLDVTGRCGIETYVLPGSHEEVHIYEPMLEFFNKRYNNIINTIENPRIDQKDHILVFLPGSDWRSGGATSYGYSLEDQHESGLYKKNNKYLRVINMKDLKKIFSNPEKTIVFSHIPRRFSNLENCVDMAEYGDTDVDFHIYQIEYQDGSPGNLVTTKTGAEFQDLLKEKKIKRIKGSTYVPNGSLFPRHVAEELLKQDGPIILRRENRGNEKLKAIFEELGVTKNITGHFHESAGRANDLDGNAVREGIYVPSLFYNASCLDRLMVGMVSINDNLVSYETINLKDYLE